MLGEMRLNVWEYEAFLRVVRLEVLELGYLFQLWAARSLLEKWYFLLSCCVTEIKEALCIFCSLFSKLLVPLACQFCRALSVGV